MGTLYVFLAMLTCLLLRLTILRSEDREVGGGEERRVYTIELALLKDGILL